MTDAMMAMERKGWMDAMAVKDKRMDAIAINHADERKTWADERKTLVD